MEKCGLSRFQHNLFRGVHGRRGGGEGPSESPVASSLLLPRLLGGVPRGGWPRGSCHEPDLPLLPGPAPSPPLSSAYVPHLERKCPQCKTHRGLSCLPPCARPSRVEAGAPDLVGSLKPAPPRAYSPSDPASGLRKNSEAGGGSLSVDTPLVEEETGGRSERRGVCFVCPGQMFKSLVPSASALRREWSEASSLGKNPCLVPKQVHQVRLPPTKSNALSPADQSLDTCALSSFATNKVMPCPQCTESPVCHPPTEQY